MMKAMENVENMEKEKGLAVFARPLPRPLPVLSVLHG